MLVQFDTEQISQFIHEDPVRPHLSAEFRTSGGRKVYALKQSDGSIDAICCVAYMFGIPTTEEDLDGLDVLTQLKQKEAGIIDSPTVVPYTIWSYSRGAGRELLLELLKKTKKDCEDWPLSYKPFFITLSPKTEMAAKFHLSNGARLIQENETTNNFEYKV